MTNRSKLQDDAVSIWWSGVRAVDPRRLTQQQVVRSADQVFIADEPFDLTGNGRIEVLGAGKAGAAMATGLEQSLLAAGLPHERLSGWVNVPEFQHERKNERSTFQADRPQLIHLCQARPAGCNEPTAAAVAGTNEILRRASSLAPNDLCVVLLSGGGSALLPAPAIGITLEDKVAVTKRLSAAGANIVELNTVRKQLSRIKGGGLARACTADRMIVFVMSDVLGDSLQTIASGPCLTNNSTASDALMILQRFDPQRSLPKSVYYFLEQKCSSNNNNSVVACSVTHRMIGNLSLAVDVAGEEADKLGWKPAMIVARQPEGTAEEVGRQLAMMAVSMLGQESPNCLITGGEPIVQLPSESIRGRGGRNQQLVLSAWQELRSQQLSADDLNRICILSGGTDGEDGPTDAAGGVIGPDQFERTDITDDMIADHLKRCDAYPLLSRCRGLLTTSPTGTNVCDIRVLLVSPKT